MPKPSTKRLADMSIRITASVARDYRRRDVFPALRIEGVEIEGTVTFRVDRNLVEQVLADARVQYERVFTGEERGTKKSYGHLIYTLRSMLEPEAVAEEARQRVEAATAAAFRVPAALLARLEIHRYGDRLLNAYGSREQLIDAGLVSPYFEFPVGEEKWASKRWSEGGVEYSISSRHASQADAAADVRSDHWWFQVNDARKPYPDDFVALHRAELGASGQSRR